MENNKFDNFLKKKLENLEVEYNPDHWNLLQDKMRLEEGVVEQGVEDIFLDGMVFDAMDKFDVPYEPAHWDLMAEKIEENFSLRYKIVKYKVAEVALMLLFIFTLFQFLPLEKKSTVSNLATVAPSIENNTSNTSSDHKNFTNSNNKEEIAKIEANQLAINSNKKETAIITSNSNPNSKSKSLNSIVETNQETDHRVSAKNNIQSVHTAAASVVPENSTTNNNIVFDKPTTFVSQVKSNTNGVVVFESEVSAPVATISDNNSSKTSELTSNHEVSLLPMVDKRKAGLLDIVTKEESLPTCNQMCTKLAVKPVHFRLGTFTAFDMNYVMTPYDDLLKKGSYSRTALGYGAGLSVGWKFKRWEIETGAIYASKRYKPQSTVEIFDGSVQEGGYFVEELKDVELNVVEIPVDLKYSFNPKSNWNFYAHSGGSLNMAVQANYGRNQSFVGSNGASGGTFGMPVAKPEESSIISQKKFSDGIFEGGTFNENYYLTLNLGFGIERHLSKRLSIFCQQSYNHQLISSGLGPNEDRINTFRISTGAKVTFK